MGSPESFSSENLPPKADKLISVIRYIRAPKPNMGKMRPSYTLPGSALEGARSLLHNKLAVAALHHIADAMGPLPSSV